MVLDGLLGLYGLKYDSATACELPSYICSYKLVSFAIGTISSSISVGKSYASGSPKSIERLNPLPRDG